MPTVKEFFAQHLPKKPIGYDENLEAFILGLEHNVRLGLDAKHSWVGNMQTVIDNVLRAPRTPVPLNTCIAVAMNAAALIKEDNHAAHCVDIVRNLVSAKNERYSFAFAKSGSKGVIVRMWDKVIRLINMHGRTGDDFEPMTETASDLIGYSALLYTMLCHEAAIRDAITAPHDMQL